MDLSPQQCIRFIAKTAATLVYILGSQCTMSSEPNHSVTRYMLDCAEVFIPARGAGGYHT